MLSHKTQKETTRSKPRNRDKMSSNNLLKGTKQRIKQERKELTKMTKKAPSKTNSRLNQANPGYSLFQSLRDLPNSKTPKSKKDNVHKKTLKKQQSNNKNEDSTASRDFVYVKQYDFPNGEYFGSRIQSKGKQRQSKKGSMTKKKSSQQNRLVQSLEKKVKQFRRLSIWQKSQSQSLKSQISDQQMRRLQKIHSVERMMIMQDIIQIEVERFHLKTQK